MSMFWDDCCIIVECSKIFVFEDKEQIFIKSLYSSKHILHLILYSLLLVFNIPYENKIKNKL